MESIIYTELHHGQYLYLSNYSKPETCASKDKWRSHRNVRVASFAYQTQFCSIWIFWVSYFISGQNMRDLHPPSMLGADHEIVASILSRRTAISSVFTGSFAIRGTRNEYRAVNAMCG